MAIIANNQQLPEVSRIDPRGDLSGVDPIRCTEHVRAIEAILNADTDEYEIADSLRAYVAEHLRADLDMYIAVNDQLAAEKVVSKAQLKNWLSLVLEV
jgi:hypothetical protein